MHFIDLSHPLTESTPAYPGDSPLLLHKATSLEKEGFTTYEIHSSFHTGTHIDLPSHLTNDARSFIDFPLEAFYGQGVFLNVWEEERISLKDDYYQKISTDTIVLFYSGHDRFFHQDSYFSSHPVLSEELVDFLIHQKVKMIGIDFPSPDYYPHSLHKKLLSNQILLLENLTNLSSLAAASSFEIYAFPLKLASEASFVRAVAKIK